MISLEEAVRSAGLPILIVWEHEVRSRKRSQNSLQLSIVWQIYQIVPFRFDLVDNLYAVRKVYPIVQLVEAEDSEATVKIVTTARSAKLRHVHRTHGVNFDWIYHVFGEPECRLRHVNAMHQNADMCTKAITKSYTWWLL